MLFFNASIGLAQVVQDTVTFEDVTVIENKTVKSAFRSVKLDSNVQSTFNQDQLSDLLTMASPIFIKSYGLGALATPTFRGTAAVHTNVVWNGFNINSPMLGQFDLALFPLGLADDIGIEYGLASLDNHSSALGGNVTLNQGPNWELSQQVRINQLLGSFGRTNSQAQVAMGNKKLQGQIHYYRQQAHNRFRYENSSKEGDPIERQVNAELYQQGLGANLYYRLNKEQQISINYWYADSERELPPTMLTPNNREVQLDEAHRLVLGWQKQQNKGFWQFRSGWFRDVINYNNPVADINSLTTGYAWRNRMDMTRELGKRVLIKAGAVFDLEEVVTSNYIEPQKRTRWAAFGGLNYQVTDRLTLDALLRQERVTDQEPPLVGRIGAHWQAWSQDRLILYANAGTNFHVPTFNDLYWSPTGNPDLQPEQSAMMEFGANSSWGGLKKGWRLEGHIAYYNMQVDNWILWHPISAVAWQPDNLREVSNRGIEAEFSSSIRMKKVWVSLTSSYQYTRAENLRALSNNDATVGKQLIYTPLHSAKAFVNMQWRSLKVFYLHTFTDQRFSDSENEEPVAAFQLASMGVSYHLGLPGQQTLNMTFRINNIWNESYQAIIWRAMPGRYYDFTLSYQLIRKAHE